MTTADTSTLEKIDLVLSNLEKLKVEVSAVESRYSTLGNDYSRLCDEALIKIIDIRAALKLDSAAMRNKIKQPVQEDRNTECSSNSGSTLEDIFCYQQKQTDYTEETKLQPHRSLIDILAGYIETSLDKIGDVLVYPLELAVNLYHRLNKRPTALS